MAALFKDIGRGFGWDESTKIKVRISRRKALEIIGV